jgi:hypothetical protein
MNHKIVIISIITPFLLAGAPIDRARMRVAEEAMQDSEKSMRDTHLVYYAAAPCPRVVRDVLKKFAEMQGSACKDLELLPCAQGSVTLTLTDRPRWQLPPYANVSERIINDLRPLLAQQKISSSFAESFGQLAPLSEGRYADLLQVCIPKNAAQKIVPRAEVPTITLSEADFKNPENGIKILRYSALHPSFEHVYSKEFASLIARMLAIQKKNVVTANQSPQ